MNTCNHELSELSQTEQINFQNYSNSALQIPRSIFLPSKSQDSVLQTNSADNSEVYLNTSFAIKDQKLQQFLEMQIQNSKSCDIENYELDENGALSSKLFKDFTLIDSRFKEFNILQADSSKK